MNQEKLLAIFKEKNALLSGHFVLSSGLHSDQYMQCSLILQYPGISEELCALIAKRFKNDAVNVVAGPALGGIVFAYELAKQLNVRTIFGERKEGPMTFRRGFSITKGDRILLAEDVITTGKSVNELRTIVEEQGGIVIGVAMIADRSKGSFNPGVKTESLIKLSFETFEPSHCPLCKKGIPAVKPGSRLSM